jgi:membrane-bound lytic murein transglycosylase B
MILLYNLPQPSIFIKFTVLQLLWGGPDVGNKLHPRGFVLCSSLSKLTFLLGLYLASIALFGASRTAASADSKLELFIGEMAEKHGIERSELEAIFSRAHYRPAILRAVSKPAEAKPWYQYRSIFINDERIRKGVAFMKQHAEPLESARQIYGVPGALTTAILGIETGYGQRKGRYVVLDALTTLAFNDLKRADLFRYELEHYLLLTREEGMVPHKMRGSYAGAMGIAQFMPSSYRRYAVDFDGDGKRDLTRNVADAIGSVANYFEAYGWEAGAPVAVRASVEKDRASDAERRKDGSRRRIEAWKKLGVAPDRHVRSSERARLIILNGEKGPEYWLGFDNFFVITEYNHSINYAMAAYQLAVEIESKRYGAVKSAKTADPSR